MAGQILNENGGVPVGDKLVEEDSRNFVLRERLKLDQPGTEAVLLTLNRPEARNPLDHGTLFQLIDAMQEADEDPEVRTILITGAGEAFSAGGDLKVYLETNRDPVAWPAAREASQRAFKAIRSCSTPVVTLVNGTAVAGGLEVILHSDFAYAAQSARIGDAHLRYGQMGGGGALALLPKVIGPARARELIFSGGLLSASEACEWGLVNRVVPDGELIDAGLEFANKVARMSPLAVANAKYVINEGIELGLGVGAHMRLEFERAVRYNLSSHDASEGLRAFSEKRTPNYLGR